MHSRALSILLLFSAGVCPSAARAAGEMPAPPVAIPALVAEPVEGLDAGEGPGFLRHYLENADSTCPSEATFSVSMP